HLLLLHLRRQKKKLHTTAFPSIVASLVFGEASPISLDHFHCNLVPNALIAGHLH
ncbi:unnamed protein product, partial [Musa acuminata subsp. burmannicoides]